MMIVTSFLTTNHKFSNNRNRHFVWLFSHLGCRWFLFLLHSFLRNEVTWDESFIISSHHQVLLLQVMPIHVPNRRAYLRGFTTFVVPSVLLWILVWLLLLLLLSHSHFPVLLFIIQAWGSNSSSSSSLYKLEEDDRHQPSINIYATLALYQRERERDGIKWVTWSNELKVEDAEKTGRARKRRW